MNSKKVFLLTIGVIMSLWACSQFDSFRMEDAAPVLYPSISPEYLTKVSSETNDLKQKLQEKISLQHYIVSFDTPGPSISFLQQHSTRTQSQVDSIINKINLQKWSATIEKKVFRFEERVMKRSEKSLRKFQKEEERIYKKLLNSKDSLMARTQLEETRNRYSAIHQKLKNPESSALTNNTGQYNPYLDTLQTVLKFLDHREMTDNFKGTLSKVQSLNNHLKQAENIKKFILQRKHNLKEHLKNLGLTKELKKLNKEFFYYSEQIKEYKKVLSDPAKMEEKVVGLVAKIPAFKEFFANNSQLSQLFRLPGSAGATTSATLAGLQTRASVLQDVQNRFGNSPAVQQMMQQNMQQAQDQLGQWKNKFQESIHMAAGDNTEDDIPHFKPNSQRVKNFWRRIETGINFQNQRSNRILPVTSDIGLSVGYKLNDKSIIGIGAGYKLGWGNNIRKIKVTHQGASIRSFIDWQLKGSFWFSGGYEINYKPALQEVSFSISGQEVSGNVWQRSGLIGISKKISLGSRFFKKTKVQLLFDFLSYNQIPKTQPVIFRVGYDF